MRLLCKNISLTKKVEFTLSSKIIQAACLFLFPGSVSKLSFDRIIIDETCQFWLQNSSACNQFFRFHFISHITSNFFFWMQICRPEKTNISFQLNAPLRRGEETHLDFVNLKTDIIAVRTFLSLWSSIGWTRFSEWLNSLARLVHRLGTVWAQLRHGLGTFFKTKMHTLCTS